MKGVLKIGLKNPIKTDKLLFNVGKYTYNNQRKLSSWENDWKKKGGIREESEDKIELEYSKEQQVSNSLVNYTYDELEYFDFIYYRKLLTKTNEDWEKEERTGEIQKGSKSREVLTIVKNLDEIRDMIEKDLKGTERLDEVVVLFCWQPLSIDIVLKSNSGVEESYTIPYLNFFDIDIVDDKSIYINFNMYEIEYEGKVIFCCRDKRVMEFHRTIYNNSNEGNKIRILKDGKEI